MTHIEIINVSAKSFYKNFSPKQNFKTYDKQAKILAAAALSIILEKELTAEPETVQLLIKEASTQIDNEIFIDPEILDSANLSETDRRFRFSFLSIKRNITRLNLFEDSLKKGSLEGSLSSFRDLLFTTYLQPLSTDDYDFYLENFPGEMLTLKEIFIHDYLDFKRNIKSLL